MCQPRVWQLVQCPAAGGFLEYFGGPPVGQPGPDRCRGRGRAERVDAPGRGRYRPGMSGRSAVGAADGAGGGRGWTLHQLRHSRLTHLAEAGIQLPLLTTKSRHTSLNSLAIYAKPTFDAVAAATAALDPDPPALIYRPAAFVACLPRFVPLSTCPAAAGPPGLARGLPAHRPFPQRPDFRSRVMSTRCGASEEVGLALEPLAEGCNTVIHVLRYPRRRVLGDT